MHFVLTNISVWCTITPKCERAVLIAFMLKTIRREFTMKKTTKIFALAISMLLCLVALTACSNKYGALKSAFEKEGFTENQSVEGVFADIKKDLEKDELEVNLHVLTKTSSLTKPSVLIIEFKSTDDLVKAYKDSNTMQGLVKDVQENEDVQKMYKSLEDAGLAKGNCLCVPMSLAYYNDIVNIVKSV